ncbi:MAG: HlyD family efflux transporter periplasmic adaptor subunit [Clostridia bacterium]|nr:HlyD family efflux transporter periplasmic adaptor subunit [Clostridia bacterium]
MTEEKIKNRGWVKNAAIIFLSVMLVLTFFSNTIMNRSLPEVSAQYAQSGTITTRIRGTGNIEAAETFEVKSEDSRKVKSVAVKTGQEVAVGDLLFVLAEGDSTELESARQTLEDLQYNYQVALINAGETDTNGENAEIVRAREKLEAAIASRDANFVTTEDISIAKTVLVTATAEYNKAVDALEAAGGVGSGGSSSYAPVQSALNARNDASTTLAAARIKYQEAYDALTEDATTQAAGTEFAVSAYMEYLAGEYDGDTTGTYTLIGSDPPVTFTHAEMSEAYSEITAAQTTYDTADYAYNAALNNYYDSFSPDNSALQKKVTETKAIMDAAQDNYDSLVNMQTTYEAAKDNVVSYQEALEAAIRSQKLETLELQRMQNQIADAAAKVTELSTGGAGGSIYAEVDGVVTTISVTAGDTANPSTAMATIEVPDRGYSVSLTVTKEQAQKVSVGDAADISTGWWGDSGLSGTLASIMPDPTAPNQSRILIFEVRGEAESGTSVTVSIGQKSRNYEVIVPNSAVREDSNGSFVLVVVAKSTPLGNRYIATRADVQVLAEDDTNTAVSGGIYAGDFVITTSTKPLESGMQVRLADD